jgi:hypothetical protein
LVDWHPIREVKQTGPNEWQLFTARSTDSPKGIILRVEFGLFREVWFRAVLCEGATSGGRELLGWTRSAERAAELIFEARSQDTHLKPHPGYPSVREG